jgi:cobalt-zinc-cadmium efflux system outer membrane protein
MCASGVVDTTTTSAPGGSGGHLAGEGIMPRDHGTSRLRAARYCGLALAAVWLAADARSQQPAPPAMAAAPTAPAPLTLADLEQLALAHNPTIAQARAGVAEQRGLYRQAGLYPNPTVGYVRTDADQTGQSQTQGAFLGQEFVTGGKLRLAQAAGRKDVELGRWQLEAQRGRVVNDLRVRFYEALGAQEAVRAALDLKRLAEEGVRATSQLVQAKQAARPDLLQAELQLSAVRTSLSDARFRLQAARRQLATIVGADLPPAPLAGGLEDGLPRLDWQASLQQLLAASPLLLAQQAEVEAARYEVRLAQAQAIPNVTAQVVIERDHVMKYTQASTLVALPLPIFNRNQGNVLAAKARLQQQLREYERIRLALTDQLAQSFRQYQTLAAQADRLRGEILPKAQENLSLTTTGYKAGQFDILRVLGARQSYFQARMAYLDAQTELHKVTTEISGLLLTGGLNPTAAGTALQGMPGATGTGTRSVLLQQLQEQKSATGRLLPGAVQAGGP